MLSSLVCRELPYDRARKELRNKTFGGSDDDGYSAQQTSDGGYIVAGYTYSYGAGGTDVWLIKVKGEEIPNQPPFASFTYSPQNPVVNEAITFEDLLLLTRMEKSYPTNGTSAMET